MTLHVLLFAFALLQPIFCAALGRWLINLLFRPTEECGGGVAFAVGILAYLWLVLLLKSLGAAWAFAAFVPFAPIVVASRNIGWAIDQLKVRASVDALLWIVTVSVIGGTLLSATNGYETAWPNAYGDYPFHIGMISSFVFGENFPPQYHVYAGEVLSYPFFVNLWAASVWWISPGPVELSQIFFIEWLIVWMVVYQLLITKSRLIPWLILLGGGSLWTLGKNSGSRIENGDLWSSFLTTVWVPQRASQLGLLVLVATTLLFIRAFQQREHDSSKMFAVAGLTQGLGFLAHGHFGLVAAAFCGISITVRVLGEGWRSWVESRGVRLLLALGLFCLAVLSTLFLIPEIHLPLLRAVLAPITALVFLSAIVLGIVVSKIELGGTHRREMLSYFLPLCAVWLTYPFFGSKISTFHPIVGWFPTEQGGWLWQEVFAWVKPCAAWFLLIAVMWSAAKKQTAFFALALLFVFFNALLFSVWPWDQLKLFIALYVISLLFISEVNAVWQRLAVGVLSLLLVIPAGYEVVAYLINGNNSQIYSKEQLARAEILRSVVPRGQVVLDEGVHNSIVGLAGRLSYLGYDGWLWSHGLPYRDRAARYTSKCRGSCPSYVLWEGKAPEKWSVLEGHLIGTQMAGLFKIRP